MGEIIKDDAPEVSVIIPIYNVEEYLDECIGGMLSQSFSDFELILVDDGSPDRSGEICDEYGKKDGRIRVIHCENGGPAKARNYGLDTARGRYICFADSDDQTASDYLETLVNAAKEYDADIVQASHTTYHSKMGTDKTDRRGHSYEIKEFNTEEAIVDYLLYNTLYANVWGKIYRRELFSSVRFPDGKHTEDEYIMHRLILRSRKVVCIPKIIYYYRLREGSVVHYYGERRFAVCEELPGLIRSEVTEAGIDRPSELDYKEMRLKLKVYNDFIQDGQYGNYKERLEKLRKEILSIPVDQSVWDGRYLKMRSLLKTVPFAYRKAVSSRRKKIYGGYESE